MKRRAKPKRAPSLWRPVSVVPNLPPDTRLWFYHPTYSYRRIRPGSVDLFVYTTDATHWCHYGDGVMPSPP